MLWPNINSYKEFDDEKKFLRLENSPPPHNFSNGPSLRGTNSTTTNYIIGTPNLNSNENSFRTLSSQRLFGSIVINLTETTLAAVMLDFSALSGTNPQISTTSTPVTFIGEYPPWVNFMLLIMM